MKRLFQASLAAFALAACGATAPNLPAPPTLPTRAAAITYSGEAFYLERIALPPTAQVTVELRDVSLADAPSRTLASQTIAGASGPPYAFSLSAPRAAVNAAAQLAIHASVRDGERVLFVTDTRIDAPKTGATGMRARMVMVRAH